MFLTIIFCIFEVFGKSASFLITQTEINMLICLYIINNFPQIFKNRELCIHYNICLIILRYFFIFCSKVNHSILIIITSHYYNHPY